MKKTYIAPKTDIETLCLLGSILEGGTDYGQYSDTAGGMTANTMNFDEGELEREINYSSRSLWEE